MQTTEPSGLGPDFDWRLKTALESIAPPTPLAANAHYRSLVSAPSWAIGRLAPALAVAAAAAIVATSATAATGSANPALWTKWAASTIGSISHLPKSKPAPITSPKPAPTHHDAPGPSRPTSTPGRGSNGPDFSPPPRDSGGTGDGSGKYRGGYAKRSQSQGQYFRH